MRSVFLVPTANKIIGMVRKHAVSGQIMIRTAAGTATKLLHFTVLGNGV